MGGIVRVVVGAIREADHHDLIDVGRVDQIDRGRLGEIKTGCKARHARVIAHAAGHVQDQHQIDLYLAAFIDAFLLAGRVRAVVLELDRIGDIDRLGEFVTVAVRERDRRRHRAGCELHGFVVAIEAVARIRLVRMLQRNVLRDTDRAVRADCNRKGRRIGASNC